MPYAESVSTAFRAEATLPSPTSTSLGLADPALDVGAVQIRAQELWGALQAQMQLRTQAELDRPAFQPVIRCVATVMAVIVDEMRVVARHRDALFKLGHPEPGERARHIGKRHLLLVLGGFGQRTVWALLFCHRAGAHHAELARHANRHH